MFYALDKNDKKIHISDANPKEFYFCQICKQKLKLIPSCQRNGQEIREHFSHIGKPQRENKVYIPCTDKWHYCMSEWHIAWQKRFPEECQECVVSNDIEKHIADVLINNTVIEFQHSKISIAEFCERNDFYTSCGYDVVWIFDLSEQIDSGVIRIDRNNHFKFYWRSVPKFFRQLCVNSEKAVIIFQLLNNNDNECRTLARVSKAYKEFSEFYAKDCYSVKEIVEEITNDIFAPDVIKQNQIKNIKGGHTILDLWKSDYYGIIVENQITGQEMVINGKNGVINRDGEKIIGKYSNRDISGKYKYSDFYFVKDQDLPIWKLIKIFERTDKEYLAQKQLHSHINKDCHIKKT